jgi:hypothetical protein
MNASMRPWPACAAGGSASWTPMMSSMYSERRVPRSEKLNPRDGVKAGIILN